MNYSKNYSDYILYVKSLNRKKVKKYLKDGSENPNYIYYETHHILPRSCGGFDTKDNLVLLTAREHFLAHYLLMKIYKDTEFFVPMQYAFFMISSKLNNKSSKAYQNARAGVVLFLTGRKRSKDFCEKNSKGHLGNKHSSETRKKMSQDRLGITRPIESCKKQSETLKNSNICSGANNSNATKVIRNDGIIFNCIKEAAEVTFPDMNNNTRIKIIHKCIYNDYVYNDWSFKLMNKSLQIIRNDGNIYESKSDAGRDSFPNINSSAACRRVVLSIKYGRSYEGFTFNQAE